MDFLGEYTAGLYGHSDPVIQAAIEQALADGIVLGAPNRYEAELARLMCARFPSLDMVRFCNSGTEANLNALSGARAATGRSHVMVFEGAYHGGMLSFAHGNSPMNVPFPYVFGRYNDLERTLGLIERHQRRARGDRDRADDGGGRLHSRPSPSSSPACARPRAAMASS